MVMNPFSSLSRFYKRWRHSRGFGVHSPFAYEIVINAVTPGKYSYYGYEDIECTLLRPDMPHYPHLRHDARLLLRMLVWTGKKRLLVYPATQPMADCVAAAAGVECVGLNAGNSSASHDDMILLRNDMTLPQDLMPFITAGAAVMALDPSQHAREQVNAGMKNGLILDGKRILIAIPRPEMALTAYSMRF